MMVWNIPLVRWCQLSHRTFLYTPKLLIVVAVEKEKKKKIQRLIPYTMIRDPKSLEGEFQEPDALDA